MSELGRAYYRERLNRLEAETDVAEFPLVLNGVQQTLLAREEGYIAIQRGDRALERLFMTRYTKVLESLHGFALSDVRLTHGDFEPAVTQVGHRRSSQASRTAHLSNLVRKFLFPGYANSGDISSICIEAVDPAEIPAAILKNATAKSPESLRDIGATDYGEVYLLTTAVRKFGLSPKAGPCGFMTMLYAGLNDVFDVGYLGQQYGRSNAQLLLEWAQPRIDAVLTAQPG